jgi:hypothetical protein
VIRYLIGRIDRFMTESFIGRKGLTDEKVWKWQQERIEVSDGANIIAWELFGA